MGKFVLTFFLVTGILSSMNGQILKDTLTLSHLEKGVDHIYNCEFSEARKTIGHLQSGYADHPVIYLLRGMVTYWEHFPLTPGSEALTSFKSDMYTCIEMCQKRRLLPGEAEYLLADIGSRGLLLTYFADNGLVREVIPLASSTYQDVVRAFDYTDLYADFYFVTGLYNYYRETYPEAHPFYKPFALLFPRGNKEKGLLQLEKAAHSSIFLKAEATTFLNLIYSGNEKNYPMALRYSKILLEKYPRNNEYLALHVRNLLLLKRYGEAETWLSKARQPESRWFNFEKCVFFAIIREKKDKNLEKAESLYRMALKEGEFFGAYASEYLSFCYFGLERIAKARGESGREYRKKGVNLASHKHMDFGN